MKQVYTIKDKRGVVKYVGVSSNTKVRFANHRTLSNASNKSFNPSKPIYVWMSQHEYMFDVVCDVEDEYAFELEELVSREYNDISPLLNKQFGTVPTGKHNPSAVSVDLYDNGVYVRSFDTTTDCAKYLGTSRSNVKNSKNRHNILMGRYSVFNKGEPFVDYTWTRDNIISSHSNAKYTHQIEYNGKIHNLSAWGRIYNIPKATLRHRIINAKWSIERALNTPVKPYKLKGGTPNGKDKS